MTRVEPPITHHDPSRRKQPPVPASDAALRRAAEALETQFLSEMLRASGLDAAPAGLGGGAAEGHVVSFLIEARAEALVRDGGIGLAESIYHSLVRARHGG